jgi:hypothetical protein
MKKIFNFATLLLSFILTLYSQQLRASELRTIEQVSRQGMIVTMGELTGAGAQMSVSRLAGLILPEGVLMKEDCTLVVVKNVQNPMVSDILKIRVLDQEIRATEFLGFVVH